MLLRRIVQGVRHQEWSTIIAELVIVVGGVFLGIQASNWNEDRLEQERGELIVERLVADLQKDHISRSQLIRYYESVFGSLERTVARFNSDGPVDSAAFVVDAYRASEYAHRAATRATYDEIVSTGDLGLISVEARQAGVIDYFGNDGSSAMRGAVLASPYRARIRRLLPYDVQSDIRENCSDAFNEKFEIVGFSETCELETSESDLLEAVASMRSDPELLPDLRLHFSVLSAQMPVFRRELINLEASISALRSED